MEEKLANGQDFLEDLKGITIHDITQMSIEAKLRWTYMFSKTNPDSDYVTEWIEERLLVYPKSKLTDVAFMFYASFLHSTVTNGQLSMRTGGSFKEEDKEKLKKDLGWVHGQFIVAIPEPDDKTVKFAVLPLSVLQIVQAQPFGVEQEKLMQNQLMYQIEQKNTEIKNLIDEYKSQWLK